jgi:hypothetical protein
MRVFGGEPDRDAGGFPASAMAAELAGDCRSEEQVFAWAAGIAAEPANAARTWARHSTVAPLGRKETKGARAVAPDIEGRSALLCDCRLVDTGLRREVSAVWSDERRRMWE